MTHGTIRIAIVGAGNIAAKYATILESVRATAPIDLVGVADKVPQAARKLADRLECPAFDSCDDLLQAAGVDLALIATPPVEHEADVLRCLQRSIHVLCEKPLAIDLASAERIDAQARRSRDALLSVGAKYRYGKDIETARRLIADGSIGDVLQVDICFARKIDMAGRWYSMPWISGGGVLMDNGPHALDLARTMMGAIREVSASPGPHPSRLQVEESVQLRMRSHDGAVARAYLSWADSTGSDNFMTVRGSFGTIEIGWHGARIRRRGAAAPESIGTGFDAQAAMRAQVLNVLQAIAGNEALVTDAADAIDNVRAICAAYATLDLPAAWCPTA